MCARAWVWNCLGALLGAWCKSAKLASRARALGCGALGHCSIALLGSVAEAGDRAAPLSGPSTGCPCGRWAMQPVPMCILVVAPSKHQPSATNPPPPRPPGAGFTAATPVVQWFWEVVREMDKQDLALLVQFVTGGWHTYM